MSLASVSTILRNHFNDAWDSEAVLAVFDNLPMTDVVEGEAYVRFLVRFADERRISTGENGLHELIGRVWLMVFTPKQRGTIAALELADQFATIFRNWRSEDGEISTATPRVESIPTNDSWYQVNVSVPFTAIYRA
jgi:hypothetical protein